MFIFNIIKGIFKKIQFLINGYLARLDKKNNDASGYILSGPKNVKKMFILMISLFLIGLFLAIFYKEGVIDESKVILDRETAPGSKLPPDLSINQGKSILITSQSKIQSEPFNCDILMSNLQKNGSFTVKEKLDYEKFCKNSFDKELIKLVDNLMDNNIQPEAVKSILANTSKDNIDNINKALENKKIIESLSGKNGELLAKELPNLANLSEDEVDKAINIIDQTPPQYRAEMIKAIGKTASLESPEARDSMLKSLSTARTPEDLKDANDFLDVAVNAKPDEQEAFTKAYELAAENPEERKLLTKAVEKTLELDESDPMRKVMVDKIKDANNLSPEDRKTLYKAIPRVVDAYQKADPEMKKMLLESAKNARNPNDLMALADRVDNYNLVKDSFEEPLDNNKIDKYIKNIDKPLVEKIQSAAVLNNCDQLDLSKQVLSGAISLADVKKKVKDCERESPSNQINSSVEQVEKKTITTPNFKQKDIDVLSNEKRRLEDQKNTLNKKLEEFIKMGIPLDNSSVTPLIKEISEINERLTVIDKNLSAARLMLKKAVEDFKSRMKNDLDEMGVSYSELDIKVKDEDIEKFQPKERLKDIKNYNEFWSGRDVALENKAITTLKYLFPKRSNISKIDLFEMVKSLKSKRAQDIMNKSIEVINNQSDIDVTAELIDTMKMTDNVEQTVIALTSVIKSKNGYVNKNFEEKRKLNLAFRSVISIKNEDDIRDSFYQKINEFNRYEDLMREEMYYVIPNIVDHYHKRKDQQKLEIKSFVNNSKSTKDLIDLSMKLDELYPVRYKNIALNKPIDELKIDKKYDTILSSVAKNKSNWEIPVGSAPVTGGNSDSQNEVQISRTLVIPGFLKRLPKTGISSKGSDTQFLFEFGISVANRKTGKISIPKGSIAICKSKGIDEDSGRLSAECEAVDVGGSEDLKVSLIVSDANGADGILGLIIDHKGWKLGGIFLTAFSAAIFDGFTAQFIEPIESKAKKGASDYMQSGLANASSAIMQELAQKQIDKWSNMPVYWVGYDGMLATVKQK